MRSMTFLVNDRSTGSGPTPTIAVTATENADGTVSFSIKVLGAVTGDLRGFFFDVANESRIGTLSVTPTSPGFTEFRQGNDNVRDLGNGANMNGLLGSDGGYDAGVEIGKAGIGHGDDYQSFSFTLRSSAGPLTLDDFANVDFGVRVNSVGGEHFCGDRDRDGESKLLETVGRAMDAKDDAGAVTEDAPVNKVTGNVFANDLYLKPDHQITAVNGSAAKIGDEINGVYGTFRLNLDGSYTYKLDNSRAATQALAAGQQVIESFTYTAKSSDEPTSSSSDSATVRITITGAADNVNAAPVITAAVATGAVTELADHAPGEGSQTHSAVGTVDFKDINLTDSHTVTVAAATAGYLGTLTASVTNPSTGDGIGQVTWNFSVPDGAIEHLGAGESRTQSYSVTINDGHGGTATQQVTITIAGANDGPVITGAVDAGTVTEDAILAASGTIDFADIDVNDGHTVAVAPDAPGYLGSFHATVSDDSTGDGTGHVSWDFSVANEAVQYLGADDILTQTYQVSVDDGHGGSTTQDVTITILGADEPNTPPQAFADFNFGDHVVESGFPLVPGAEFPDPFASGNVLANDFDPDPFPGLHVSAVNGSSANVFSPVTGTYGALTVLPDGTWTYQLDDADPDTNGLGQYEFAADQFFYTATDAFGASSSSTLTVWITGANDAPVATGGTTSGVVTEDDGTFASGEVTFTDVDRVDFHRATFSPSPANTTSLGSFFLESPVITDGSVGWGYSLNNSAAQSLAQDQIVNETYVVSITDPWGVEAFQHVTVAITGANDGPDAVDDVLGGGGDGAMSVAVVYQGLSGAITSTVDQINNDTWFDFTATAVHYTDADSIEELAQYDVVLLGNSQLETFSAEFWAAIHQYSESAEGGVVSNGWTNFSLGQVRFAFGLAAFADYDAVVPVNGQFGYNSINTVPFVPLSGGHPITDGILGIHVGVGSYVVSSNSLDPGAHSLATLFGSDSALAYQDQPGAGHTVYLGFHYTDAVDHDAAMANSVDGDRLLEQALHWAGGATGNSGAATDENHALGISSARLLSNDTDVDTGDTLSIVSVSATSALGATVSLDGLGNVTYDPTQVLQYLAKGQTADDAFSYTISDNHGAADTATVTLSVAGVNDAPLTTGGVTSGALAEDASLLASGDVTFTDVDLIDTHSVTFSASPSNTTSLGTFSLGVVNESPATADGSVSWSYALNNGAAQSLAEGQTVVETYAVKVADGEGASATRDVTVAITGANDRPDAVDDVLGGGGGAMSVAVVYQTLSSTISATVDQINNDTWFDFAATAVHYTDADSIGELAQYDVVLLGNSYYEQFSADFWAAIHQYSASAEGGVVSNGWTNYSLDQVRSAFGLVANADYDAVVPVTGNSEYNVSYLPFVPLSGGHPITDGISGIQAGYYVTSSLHLDPGAVSLATLFGSDSALAYQEQPGDGHTVYLGFHYTDAEYRDWAMASSVDGDRLLEQALHWAGGGAGDPATDEDHALTISSATLLANDKDIDTGDLLSILSVSGTSTLGASVSLDGLGNVVYDPTPALQYLAEGQIVTDTFTYTISDNHGATDTATVSLTVMGLEDLSPNTPPVANPDTNAGDPVVEAGGFTQPGFPPSGDPMAFGNVLANDFDPDFNPGLHVTSVNGFEPSSFLPVFGTYGRLFLQSDGSWNYILDDLDPDTNALAQGATAVDQFTYTIADAQGAGATSTLGVSINGTNDLPMANPDSATASENGATTIAVLANDHDPDTGAVLRVGALFSPMSNGSVSTLGATLVANPDGTVRYDPRTSAMLRALNDGESVTDSFNYIVFDEKGASAGGTVSVLVQGANNVAPEGQVFEDGSRHASGHLAPPPGVDPSSTSWTVHDSTFVATPDYRFSMDALRITRNGTTYFEDEFTAGGPPPQAPTLSGTTTPVSYFLQTGTSIIETNGRAILDGSSSAAISVLAGSPPFHGHSATLATDTTPDLALGLKIDDDFRVEGRFDLVFPDQPLEAYGIRLVDQNGSDTVDVRVRMEPNGSLTVVLREVDVPTNSTTILGSVALAPHPDENQIVLRLTHSPSEPGAIHASFSLLNQTPTGTVGRDFDFGPAAGHIFGTGTPGDTSDDELYTRVQISAVAPSDLQNGAFGTLHLDADGDWTYALDNFSPAVQALAQGEHASDTFTVSASDGLGGHVTKTIAVDVVGSGDFPAVASPSPSAFNGGFVVEDGPLVQQQVTGTAFGTDVDHGASLHWSVSRNPYSSNYLFRLDDLTITKNSGAFFNDGFDGGGAPPALPPGVTTGFGYATSGTLTESLGRLVFNGQVAAARQGVGVDELVAGHLLTLISNTDPGDLTRGLKSDDDFAVTARYDLSLPAISGQSYGVSLTDNMSGGLAPDQQGDDVITVEVARVGSEVRVQLLDRDVAADTTTVLESLLLTPLSGEDQIVMRLNHSASQLGTVHASFDLLSGGVLSRHVDFIQTAHIFGTDTPGYAGDDENWTRVQLITTGPDQGGTLVQGNFGSFSIDAATGAWTYTLDNGLPAVQNLASGAAVTDNFNVRVIDEHGLSTSRPFNFTVVGAADGPAPTIPTTVVPDPVNNPTQQVITGTGGNDTLAGGSGADLLFGLAGADTFDFNNLGDAGDTIGDFSSSQGDKLDLRDLIASLPGYMPGVTDPASLVFFNETPPVQGTRPGTLVFVDNDGLPFGPGTLVATLEGVTGLQYSDLILS